jgi:hypothetical protein
MFGHSTIGFQGSYGNPNVVFGVPLDRLTTKNIGCNTYHPVPRYAHFDNWMVFCNKVTVSIIIDRVSI